MMSDASEMLAAALEQMDGIIAGSKAMDYSNGLFDCQSPASPFLGGVRVVHLLEDLRGAVELMETEERESLRAQVPVSTAEGVVEWLQGRLTNGHGSVAGDLVYQERLARVESDKECLVLQVSVLTDQVEVQGEKIKDLEMCLEEHRMKLNATEELLQQELLSRSTLETQKLELLTEISSLKLKVATVDRDNRESEDLYEELGEMRLRMAAAETEKLQHERNLKSTKEELMVLQRELELRSLREQSGPEDMTSDAVQSREKDLEVQRLKQAVESLMVSNHEKDCKIEELQQSLMRYRKVQDMVMSVQKDRAKEEDTRVGLGEGSTTVSEASNAENVSLGGTEETDEPQVIPCAELAPEFELPNTSQSKAIDELQPILVTHGSQVEGPKSEVSAPPISRDEAETEDKVGKQSSSPAVSPSQVSPGGNESFGTRKSRSSFGRGFFKIRSGKRTASAPDLAESERKRTEHLDLAEAPRPRPKEGDLSSPETKKKAKGIRRFLGMMKRSQSTSFNLEEAESEFKRGGVRATAGPRLGWSRDMQQSNNNELITPFAHWSKEQVFAWLQEQGLGLYISQAQHWIRSGQTLLNASQHELEKELGIRHPLHRKKLHLAIQALGTEEDAKGKLDFNWVTRWLDDIGLPQYKSQFDDGRVDGRMLHYMTVDDLLSLKVGSVLHHLSIKRAIQVLRINHYEPSCLRRRPSDENNMAPIEICQWTNHRVMEWLRSVDLAEYAPNLRGSGVHGGLMVLEPRFNVETMALLLNIPPNKSLLRRHLATHFHLLIGAEAQRLKQECLENPDYSPLTATARVKPRRLSFGGFGTLRRKRQEESEEFVCPMDVQMPQSRSFHGSLRIYGDNLDQLDQMDDSEGTVRQIGVFSEGINNLTSMLKEDEFFKEVSSCSHDAGTAENESSA